MGPALSSTRTGVEQTEFRRPFSRQRQFRPDSGVEADRIDALIARARDGDRDALGDLYRRYAQSVFVSVYRILQDTHEAEDVTQQVFLKLISALQQYRRREVPFSAWLMRVARNVALDTDRKRGPIRCQYVQDPDGEEDFQQHGLWDALAALPTAQRRVVVMRHIVGLSAPEVAQHMGKTTGSIHALDQRGRRTLQADLIELGSAPATREQTRSGLRVVAN
ncbi:MAG: sigma-70 family RNA polymerase sigma factor [Solirubrobacterales bacterium]|nr:sigma-70 family RNA polymerase sigma factor [Solirubrobacterales bacterium]MBV9311158.1 sigma-70 family RNA polymerase sigma factor [Solirubrobacterales bacterium]